MTHEIKTTVVMGAYDKPDWRGDVLPAVKARRCPACHGHVRPVTLRVRTGKGEPLRLAYFMICRNHCIPLADPERCQTALFVLEVDSPRGRVPSGRVKDVTHAIDLWNHTADRYAGLPAGGQDLWDEESRCPVCGHVSLVSETFDRAGRPWTGCAKHPTVAAVPVVTNYTGRSTIADLEWLTDLWATWLHGHHCGICDTDADLHVDDKTGLFMCTCRCDKPGDAHGSDKPTAAVREWYKRDRQREQERTALREKTRNATLLLADVTRELGEA